MWAFKKYFKIASAISDNNLHQLAWKESFLPEVLESGEAITWKSTLQTSHKTTKWTDLLTEPEEMAANGQTCERLIKKMQETTDLHDFRACVL